MLKNKIELIRDGAPRVLLTWHKLDESGGIIPIAVEYLTDVAPALKQSVERVAQQSLNASVNGTTKRVQPGTSPHFLALPKALERLGFRARVY